MPRTFFAAHPVHPGCAAKLGPANRKKADQRADGRLAEARRVCGGVRSPTPASRATRAARRDGLIVRRRGGERDYYCRRAEPCGQMTKSNDADTYQRAAHKRCAPDTLSRAASNLLPANISIVAQPHRGHAHFDRRGAGWYRRVEGRGAVSARAKANISSWAARAMPSARHLLHYAMEAWFVARRFARSSSGLAKGLIPGRRAASGVLGGKGACAAAWCRPIANVGSVGVKSRETHGEAAAPP